MNCLNCSNWSLKDSPLRVYGYGKCRALNADENPGRSFSSENVCRFNKFAQAPAETVAKREKVIG
ncbi:hypothetical protein QFZ42_003332 [Variovorax paradoxus]|uniref:hypothetical protein n=1 Tax=Variovorax paradoxus TaxID=34073 RepID=UPI002791A657|nr:hypothetical protein [Variovorax paradoxus]MDQ0571498.1 hypothetical protein [Variovorax paradoxus]